MTQLAKISVPSPMRESAITQFGSDLDAGAKMNLADEHGIDIDEHVAAHLDVAADVDARRIRQSRAGEHQFAGALTPQSRFDFAS